MAHDMVEAAFGDGAGGSTADKCGVVGQRTHHSGNAQTVGLAGGAPSGADVPRRPLQS